MSKQKSENQALKAFRESTEAAIAKIERPEDFWESDTVTKNINKIRMDLLKRHLDQMPMGLLLRYGGELSGYMFSLGNKASYERAVRDVYEQKLEDVSAKMLVEAYADKGEKKVTLAKAQIKEALAEVEEAIIIQNHKKNNYENLLEATRQMIMFIQSALSIQKGEKYVSTGMHNNGGQG